MTYTAKQIENAKRNYFNFLKFETAQDDSNYECNPFEAERRAEYHNKQVTEILNGNKTTEKFWKTFFLNEEVKKDQKAIASREKLNANKEASADILAPIKSMRKLGDFGKWLNTAGNPFRKQHFNKKYTIEAVNTFLTTI